jgi:hypothetical protein
MEDLAMKKIYLQPETMVINVNLESAMLFGSGGGDTINGGGDKGPFDPEHQTMGSRGGRYDWDDEDEEEDY